MKTIRHYTLTCLAALLLIAAAPSMRGAPTLISFNDFWLFWADGTAPASNWSQRGFDDSSWFWGIAQFGYGEGDEFTPLNPAPNGAPLNTAYFRTTFNVANAADYANLTLRVWRDDGAIVYINGVEVFRSNMPTGAVNYATPAIRNIGAEEEFKILRRIIPASVLVSGANVVAVEIHQASGGQDDMSFDFMLMAHPVRENQPPSVTSSMISVLKDSTVNFTLVGSDPENDPLNFTIDTFPANGTLDGAAPNLTYTPAPGFTGSDVLAFYVFDGEWISELGYVFIEVTGPNANPTAEGQNLTVAAGTSVAVALNAHDADGDVLAYSYTQAAHGTVSGAPSAGNAVVSYQAPANYSGPDTFTFSVDDGRGGTATARITINVTSANQPPTAVARVARVWSPANLVSHLVLLTLPNRDARAVFNATRSSDADGDALQFAWYRGMETTPFSTASTGTVSLPRGQHTLTLVVSDGVATASDTATVRVITVFDLIHALAEKLDGASVKPARRALLAGHLVAAYQSFERGRSSSGVRHLRAFQSRVNTRVAGENSATAAQLSAEVQQIIDQVSGM